MDNQQGTLTDADIGWIAGLMDGEGSITMNVRRKSWKGWNGIGVDVSLYFTNTDARIVRKVVELLERLIGSRPYVYEGQTKELYRADGTSYHNAAKSLLQVHIGKMSHIETVLAAIEPHLAGEKRDRSVLIREFIRRRREHKGVHTKGGASWYNGYDWAIVGRFYQLSGGKLLPEVQGLLNEHEQDRQLAG